jgi:hypothetical protein
MTHTIVSDGPNIEWPQPGYTVLIKEWPKYWSGELKNPVFVVVDYCEGCEDWWPLNMLNSKQFCPRCVRVGAPGGVNIRKPLYFPLSPRSGRDRVTSRAREGDNLKCVASTHDHEDELREGLMRCSHCDEPCHYDALVEDYQHDFESTPDCFLIKRRNGATLCIRIGDR